MNSIEGPPGPESPPFGLSIREKSITEGEKKGMKRRKREAGELADVNHEK